MDATLNPQNWSTGRKIWFRFVAAYLFIYMFPFALDNFLGGLWTSVAALFDPLINWVGHTVFHFKTDVKLEPNGSGDTSYNYAQEVVFVILAIAAAFVWSFIDRRRSNYQRLFYWLKVLVRYYLALMLMVYGISKFGNGQFPAPDLMRLLQPYGKSSPMGLAWTFLGFSPAYGIYMGIAECAGGVLMLFRRTTLLGACIATTVIMNVVMINFCYDVPVKLFSVHLLIMCLFVLASEGARFMNLFIYNKPVEPLTMTPVFQKRNLQVVRIVAKTLMILLLASLPVFIMADTGDDDVKPPLYGIYHVKTFIRNGTEVLPLTTDSTRWSKLVVSYPGYAAVRLMTERTQYYTFQPDTARKLVELSSNNDSTKSGVLTYQRADSTLHLSGIFAGDTLDISMQRYDETKYLLTNRGFHWINEYPLNR